LASAAGSGGIAKKVHLLFQKLHEPFVGREDEARSIVLALLAKEHAVLVGEPGTAKSAMARRLAELLNARFFKYLLTKYTEPSELFGPLDLRALREGKYARITHGKLPEAEIVFLDEVFNANSAILNALLSIMQERVWYDGYTEIRVPLWTLIGATNRVPEEPELEAVYDRFLVRQYARPLPENKWRELLDSAWRLEAGLVEKPSPIMSLDELREVHKLIFNVDVEAVKSKLLRLFAVLEERGIHLTDRRKAKTLKLVAANAVLEGRLRAEERDLLVLKYTAPKELQDFDKVNIILSEELKMPERYMRELKDIRNNVQEAAQLVDSMRSYDPRLVDLYRSLKIAKSRIISIMRETDDSKVQSLARDTLAEIDSLLEKIALKLGM